MNRLKTATAALLLASFIGVPSTPVLAKHDDEKDHHNKREQRIAREAYEQGYWDASHHYREDNARYKPRRLGKNDTVYRGSDNRYYCTRDDGTSGLIIGGLAGGALGNIIAPGGSKVLGTLIGGAGGAIIGQQIDKGDVVCR